jgi:hypothetical protein
MPRKTKATPVRRRAPRQMELFAGGPQKAIGDMPAWSGLPTEIQAALTDLMTRLILEHADKDGIGARPVMISEKIRPHHLGRKALLYVRQSSALAERPQEAGVTAVTAREREVGEELGNALIEDGAVVAASFVAEG